MTKEKAVEIIKNIYEKQIKDEFRLEIKDDVYTKIDEAFNMAIKALEQQPSDDCISRQAVIDLINADWKYEGLELSVNELPSVTPVQRWISVSERLPENEGLYLVSVENDHLRHYSKTAWFTIHKNWFSRQDVIAWQPLPQPYEEKRGSEDEIN